MSEAAIAKENLEDVEGALKVFEEEYSLADVASALAEIVFLYMNEDRLEDELAAGLRSVSLYREMEDLRGELFARSRLGLAFGLAGFPQADDIGEKALKIAEKVGDSNLISILLLNRSSSYEYVVRDFRAAVGQALKAAEYAEKTESYYALTNCYSALVRGYAKLGDIGHAEEFSKKIDRLFNQVAILRNNAELAEDVRFNEAFLLVAKGRWKEGNEIFEKFFDPRLKPSYWGLYGSAIRAHRKIGYAWALERQGRTLEAKMQLEEAQKMKKKLTEGLERANIRAYLIARREIGVGEELNVRLDLVNVAKNPALLVRVEGLIPPGFKVSARPSYYAMQNGSLEMNERKLNPFEVEPAKLNLQASKAGVYTLTPQVVYIDDLGKTKTCKPKPVTITVRPTLHAKIGQETISVPILPGRVATGFADLDVLLYGGIPKNYAVTLSSPSIDERSLIVKQFLETGARTGETTFLITIEAEYAKALAEKYQSSFYLLICNPQADAIILNLPNVFKLKGVESLTDIDIILTKAFRTVSPSTTSARRICIEVVSDVLLQHHAVNTRRWLSALLPTLKLKGFTILAVVDPSMHPSEELQAVLGVFDGEIRITEEETPEGTKQILKIRKLINQKYLDNEAVITKERLEV
jgi:KaiC/GvpD/RAD55 family RecA-like ATPase/tetratricopeptide (TPR) repeat protein